MIKSFTFITTCRGRLAHLKKSSRALLLDPHINNDPGGHHYVVVCDHCPDDSGTWLKKTYGSRVNVKHTPFPPYLLHKNLVAYFQKTNALNFGASSPQTNYLVFLDADTIVAPRLLQFLQKEATPNNFLVCFPDKTHRDLSGFLCVSVKAFEKIGGYDTRMFGWGAEDLDIRLRLYFSGLSFVPVPTNLLSAIPHSDELRKRFNGDVSLQSTYKFNLRLLEKNVQRITKKSTKEHLAGPQARDIRVLLGQECPPPPLQQQV